MSVSESTIFLYLRFIVPSHPQIGGPGHTGLKAEHQANKLFRVAYSVEFFNLFGLSTTGSAIEDRVVA
jgi:hypothetical protein